MAVAIVEGEPSKELAMALAYLSERTLWTRSIDAAVALANGQSTSP